MCTDIIKPKIAHKLQPRIPGNFIDKTPFTIIVLTMKLTMSKLFLVFCIVAVIATPSFQSEEEEDTGDEPVAAEPEVHQDEAVEEEAVADPDAVEIDVSISLL